MKRRDVLIAVGVGGAGALAFWLWPTDEDRVKRLVNELAEVGTLPKERGSPLAFANETKKKLDHLLAPEARFSAPELGDDTIGVGELLGALSEWGDRAESSELKLLQPKIHFRTKDEATVDATADLVVVERGGVRRHETRPIQMVAKRGDDGFRIVLIVVGEVK